MTMRVETMSAQRTLRVRIQKKEVHWNRTSNSHPDPGEHTDNHEEADMEGAPNHREVSKVAEIGEASDSENEVNTTHRIPSNAKQINRSGVAVAGDKSDGTSAGTNNETNPVDGDSIVNHPA